MKKIIFLAVFIVMIAGAFFFYNSQKSVIADDKDGKCSNTECPKYSDCQKQCDKQCEKKCDDGKCEKKCDSKKEGQSQMNNCPKSNCQQNTGCGSKNEGVQKTGKCPGQK